jgi:hypothetical protein
VVPCHQGRSFVASLRSTLDTAAPTALQAEDREEQEGLAKSPFDRGGAAFLGFSAGRVVGGNRKVLVPVRWVVGWFLLALSRWVSAVGVVVGWVVPRAFGLAPLMDGWLGGPLRVGLWSGATGACRFRVRRLDLG